MQKNISQNRNQRNCDLLEENNVRGKKDKSISEEINRLTETLSK